jgi:hypothetical protein
MSDLVKRLKARTRKVHSTVFSKDVPDEFCREAAARITELEAENARLKAELLEAQKDESSLLLIAHLDGADKGRKAGRAEALEKAAKAANQAWLDGVPVAEIAAAIRALGEKTG